MKLVSFLFAFVCFILAAFNVTAISNIVDWGFVFLTVGFILGSDLSFIKFKQ